MEVNGTVVTEQGCGSIPTDVVRVDGSRIRRRAGIRISC